MEEHVGENWHADKRVPIALLMAILLQTSGMVWWAASLQARVEVVEADKERTQIELAALEAVVNAQTTQFARVEQQLSFANENLQRLERQLERLYNTLQPGGE